MKEAEIAFLPQSNRLYNKTSTGNVLAGLIDATQPFFPKLSSHIL